MPITIKCQENICYADTHISILYLIILLYKNVYITYWGYDEWGETGGYAVGHGLGISLHELPFISYPGSKENPVKLEEGMVIALETWAGPKGGKNGVRLEEVVAVTKDGYDLLRLWPVAELTECPI